MPNLTYYASNEYQIGQNHLISKTKMAALDLLLSLYTQMMTITISRIRQKAISKAQRWDTSNSSNDFLMLNI